MNRSKSFSGVPTDYGHSSQAETNHPATNPWTARARARSQGWATIEGPVQDAFEIKFTPSSSSSPWSTTSLPHSSSASDVENAKDSAIASHGTTLPEPRTAGDTSGCSLTSSCLMSPDRTSASSPCKGRGATDIEVQERSTGYGSREKAIKLENSSPVFGPSYDMVPDSFPAGEHEYMSSSAWIVADCVV